MIWTLFRQDTGLQSMPLKIIPSLMFGYLFRRDLELLPADTGSGSVSSLGAGVSFLFFFIFCLHILYIVYAGSWSRCSRLNMTLPISTRKLWLVRIFSIILSGLIPLAIMAVVLSLQFTGDGSRPSLHVGLLSLAAHMGAGLVLAAVLFQLPYTGLYRIRGLDYVILSVGIGFGVLILLTLIPISPFFLIIILSAAVLLGAGIYLSLPESFSLVSVSPSGGRDYDEPQRAAPQDGLVPEETRDFTVRSSEGESGPGGPEPGSPEPARESDHSARGADEGETVGTGIRAGRGRDYRRFLFFTAWRTLQNNVGSWFILLGLFFFGIIMSNAYHEGEATEAANIIFVLLLWGQTVIAASRVHKLDFLPVARRLLFATAVLPGFAAILLGAGAAELDNATSPRKKAQVNYKEFRIEVPRECWEIARDGHPPAAVSPWGESFVPPTHNLYNGSSLAVYNPYGFGPDSSPAFAALQIARAVSAVHGNTGPPGEAAGLSEGDEAFKAAIAGGRFAVAASIGRGSDIRNRVYAVSTLICGIFGMVFLSVALKQYGPTLYKSLFKVSTYAIYILVAFSYMIFLVMEQAGIANGWVLHTFILVYIRKLCEALPLGTPVLWALAGAVLLCGYLVIRGAFNRIEAPVRRPNKEYLQEF